MITKRFVLAISNDGFNGNVRTSLCRCNNFGYAVLAR